MFSVRPMRSRRRRLFGGSAQQFFGFGEFHLDRLEIGAVGRQE